MMDGPGRLLPIEAMLKTVCPDGHVNTSQARGEIFAYISTGQHERPPGWWMIPESGEGGYWCDVRAKAGDWDDLFRKAAAVVIDVVLWSKKKPVRKVEIPADLLDQAADVIERLRGRVTA